MHTRRQFLFDSYLGLGSLALFDLLGAEASQADASVATNPLSPRPQHHPAKAKNCIFLFMEGGVSQMDTFEYKPALWKYAGQQMPQGRAHRGRDCDLFGGSQSHHSTFLGVQAARAIGTMDVRLAAEPCDARR